MRYNSLKIISHKTYSLGRFSHSSIRLAMPWFIEFQKPFLCLTRCANMCALVLSIRLPRVLDIQHLLSIESRIHASFQEPASLCFSQMRILQLTSASGIRYIKMSSCRMKKLNKLKSFLFMALQWRS